MINALLNHKEKYMTKDKTLFIDSQDIGKILRSSSNEWMKGLNTQVKANYSDQEPLDSLRNSTLLVTFNSRTDIVYDYPDSDLENLENFPHENFVFGRILAQ
ncbi:unnamed protein product [Brachionus calyciflorus]|uniref:Uncharacterized protein n=1 Tax=Brachionus calyciflorus TaxID=104777 RepID=A0A813T1S2_9BILA|nr:unnamed protein product [Brachionus calyciflorus]